MCHLQPAAGCHTCALERQATVSQDWDINHTGLKKKKKRERARRRITLFKYVTGDYDGRKIYRTREEII